MLNTERERVCVCASGGLGHLREQRGRAEPYVSSLLRIQLEQARTVKRASGCEKGFSRRLGDPEEKKPGPSQPLPPRVLPYSGRSCRESRSGSASSRFVWSAAPGYSKSRTPMPEPSGTLILTRPPCIRPACRVGYLRPRTPWHPNP